MVSEAHDKISSAKNRLKDKMKSLTELVRNDLSYKRMLKRNEKTYRLVDRQDVKIKLPLMLVSIPEGPKNELHVREYNSSRLELISA